LFLEKLSQNNIEMIIEINKEINIDTNIDIFNHIFFKPTIIFKDTTIQLIPTYTHQGRAFYRTCPEDFQHVN
jgi:hypothetical protein